MIIQQNSDKTSFNQMQWGGSLGSQLQVSSYKSKALFEAQSKINNSIDLGVESNFMKNLAVNSEVAGMLVKEQTDAQDIYHSVKVSIRKVVF